MQVSFPYLETSILQVTFINSNEHSAHVREETAILVPIAAEFFDIEFPYIDWLRESTVLYP